MNDLTLPASDDSARAANAGAPLATVLIVDDDRATRAMVRAVLARERYRVVEAPDGQAAIAAVQAERPDLILMDVMMPVLDGHAACAHIRRLLADDALPIVMLTAADDIDSIEAAFEAGATDFITKPINWALLRQRVRYALRAGDLTREVRRARLRELSVRKIAGLGYWEWHLDTDRLRWSDEIEPLAGLDAREGVSRQDFLDRVHTDDRARLNAALGAVRDDGARLEQEFRIRVRDSDRVVRVVGERGRHGDDAQCVMGVFQDVTDMRRTEALVDYLSLHDDTTALPNRRLFLHRAAQHIEAAGGGQKAVVLIGTVDIHRFGRYNETLGESGANELLALLGQRLRRAMDERVIADAARIGGDEFAVAIQAADEAAALAQWRRVLTLLRQPVMLREQSWLLTMSAGWALCPRHGCEPQSLLTLAQEAQQRARTQGRDDMGAQADDARTQRRQRLLSMEAALAQALARDEWCLFYQPQMDFGTGRIVGYEALLRWQSPQFGMVSPVEFVPLLEESGLIVDVGAWVLETAARQAAAWERAGLALRVGINLSPRQFLAPVLPGQIESALRASGVSPHCIELEITESLAMQDIDHTVRLLQRYRAAGVKVAIDDFGVGHSSLAYVLQFPVDAIKIDRAFVTHITRGPADRAIVRAVVALGQSLGVDVIAEGVETQRQCDFLEAIGVTQVQGYLIGRPMPATDLEALARDYCRTL
ncbi:putative signaling protein [Tepidimonas thermarum]|uniref:Putative signaling protein n=1 Tax=Tepidimonas thermarum TaxID=335431 RepID=A0A554X175_9BURK|nr:EAL domain-containing protein [Tepidimonas thermarum]TSE29573.1 putative signaling protein [Tepidimonas thermarum]